MRKPFLTNDGVQKGFGREKHMVNEPIGMTSAGLRGGSNRGRRANGNTKGSPGKGFAKHAPELRRRERV